MSLTGLSCLDYEWAYPPCSPTALGWELIPSFIGFLMVGNLLEKHGMQLNELSQGWFSLLEGSAFSFSGPRVTSALKG